MGMKIFMVLMQNSEFTIIVHAAPDEIGTFQWYWMNDPNQDLEINIKGAVHESITLSSDEIQEHYQGKWLACHCHIDGEDFPYNQGCVYLTSDFGEMIRRNHFDKILLIGEDGDFRDDLCYVPASPKEIKVMDDCINRKAMIEDLKTRLNAMNQMKLYNNAHSVERFIHYVERFPSTKAKEVKHGYWKSNGRCSCCEAFSVSHGADFCSNCGAVMDIERED